MMMKFVFALILAVALPCFAASYYLSPSGSDGNNGTSTGTPWLTPNHALNCGDTITAAAGTYAAANFTTGQWGTVTCAAGNNVAWLQCATFDACYISANSAGGLATIYVDKSYWGVQGWEVTNQNNQYQACFGAFPNAASPVQIHHIIFANDVARYCFGSGFSSANNGLVGVDYLVVMGDIAYDTVLGNGECYSAINYYQPVNSDAKPGTHLYIAGNFVWNNIEPATCNGGTPSDGLGITLDTFSGVNTASLPAYSGQTVVDNNIAIYNGSAGLGTGGGGSTVAPIFWRGNTLYANYQDTHQNDSICGQLQIEGYPVGSSTLVRHLQAWLNLAVPGSSTPGCGSNNAYALYAYNTDGTDAAYQNFGYSAAGNNTQAVSSTGFSFGPNNTFGTNPAFVNSVEPGAPSCGSYSTTTACMATMIANFTPTAAVAKPYGYQPVSTTSRYDPLYPQWLCSVTNLPNGLVTPGCVVGGNWQ